MSLKAELETWAAALESYDAEDFSKAIEQFNAIADTSKICWNIGIILATLGRHKEAVDKFEEAVSLDGFMTVGYHQKGVSNFMLRRYDQALKDFEDAFLYLRGNQTMRAGYIRSIAKLTRYSNYEQLGLDFRLYAAEILFNCGLVKIYLGQTTAGMQDLREAQTQKQNEEHEVIDDAIRDQGRDYNVFSVPVGILFRPPPAKLKNLAARDYMGKAVLVAASDVNEAYTTFTGITRLHRGQTPTGAPLDPSHPLARSASVSAVPMTAARALPPSTRILRSGSDTSLPLAREDSRPTRTPFRNQSISSIPPRPMTSSPTLNAAPVRAPTLPRKPSIAGKRPLIPAPRLQTSVPRPTLHVDIDDDPLIQTPEDDDRNALRLTQMYDNYYQSGALDDDMPDLPPIGGTKELQVEAWSKKTPLGISPGGVKAPPSSFAHGGGLKRWPSRAGSYTSRLEDDQSETPSTGDMLKVRVKVHIGSLTRGMSVVPEDTYVDFSSALYSKFPELSRGMVVRFKDEDEDMMTMQDDGDYEAAIDVARVHSKGRAEGKLEVWIE